MTPFFPSQFTAARTTPCATCQTAEGVAVAMQGGHLIISVVRGDGSGFAVVLDDDGADRFAGHVAEAIMAMTRREAPTLRVVQ